MQRQEKKPPYGDRHPASRRFGREVGEQIITEYLREVANGKITWETHLRLISLGSGGKYFGEATEENLQSRQPIGWKRIHISHENIPKSEEQHYLLKPKSPQEFDVFIDDNIGDGSAYHHVMKSARVQQTRHPELAIVKFAAFADLRGLSDYTCTHGYNMLDYAWKSMINRGANLAAYMKALITSRPNKRSERPLHIIQERPMPNPLDAIMTRREMAKGIKDEFAYYTAAFLAIRNEKNENEKT